MVRVVNSLATNTEPSCWETVPRLWLPQIRGGMCEGHRGERLRTQKTKDWDEKKARKLVKKKTKKQEGMQAKAR